MSRFLTCLSLCLAVASTQAAPVPQENPEKYWNSKQLLQDIPDFKDSTYPDSDYKGLRAILFDSFNNAPKQPKSVFAYIGVPDGPAPQGGFPGIVLVHGGGGTAYGWGVDLWRSYGYAVIAIDWYNRRPTGPNGSPQVPLPEGQRQNHVLNVANMVRAHNILRNLPNVNPERTAFVGLSWGSWYGAMVAAVDPRFKCAVEIYCGDYRPQSDSFINGRFLHAAKIPMYWIAGTNDQNVTPESLQAAWTHCPMTWNKSMVINLPHSHVGYRFIACKRVVDHFLKGNAPLPKLEGGTLKNGILTAQIIHPGQGIKKAILCYTRDRILPTHKRTWHAVPATINGNTVSAALPEKAHQAYLSVYDDPNLENYCCGSTDILTLP